MDRIELRLKHFSVPVSSSLAFIGITSFYIKTDWREKSMSEICMNRRNAKNSSSSEVFWWYSSSRNWEFEAKSLPASVNSTKKKEKEIQHFHWYHSEEDTTFVCFLLSRKTLAVQQPSRNLRYTEILERKRPIGFQNSKSLTNILKHLFLLWNYWTKHTVLNCLENSSWQKGCKCSHKPKNLPGVEKTAQEVNGRICCPSYSLS